MRFLAITTVFAMLCSIANANELEQDVVDERVIECGEKLEGDSKVIFEKLLPTEWLEERSENEKIVRSIVRKMVIDGEISLFGARKNALAAVECIEAAEEENAEVKQ